MPQFPTILARNAPQGFLQAPSPGVVDLSGVSQIAGSMADAQNRSLVREVGEVRQRQHEEEQLRKEREREAKAQQQDEARVSVMNAINTKKADLFEELNREQENAPSGAPGFTEQALKRFDEWAQKAEQEAPELGRQMFKQQAQGMRLDVHQKAYAFEAGARRAKVTADFETGLDSAGRLVWANPSEYAEARARTVATARSISGLPENVRALLAKRSDDKLTTLAAMRLAEIDPIGTLKALGSPLAPAGATPNGHPALKALDPDKMQSVESHARTTMNRDKSQGTQALQAQERDLQAMVLAGVPPPQSAVPREADYVAAFGADGSRRYQTEVQTYLQVGDALRMMKVASPQERAALIASATPQAGAGFAEQKRVQDAMLQANAHLAKRLKEDPAQYAAEVSPRVQEAAASMAMVLQDPSTMSAAAMKQAGFRDGPQRAVIDSYALAQNAEQTRLGASEPHLLTDQQAKGIVQQFYDQRTGGRKSAELVAELEQTWGRWWPQVFAQLAKDEKLPPAALVIPNMKDMGARTRLAEFASMKPDERKALLAPTDARDITEKLQSEFAGAAPTFLAQGGGAPRTLSTFIDQAEILAQGYKAAGKKTGDAAKQAFDEVMGWQYDFFATYRVPKTQQPKEVEEGAKSFLMAAERIRPIVPGIQGMTPEAVQAQTLDAIRTNAMWVTNNDESGLRLMVKGQDGGVYPVRYQDGKPINLTWSELRSQALTARTERALSVSRRISGAK